MDTSHTSDRLTGSGRPPSLVKATVRPFGEKRGSPSTPGRVTSGRTAPPDDGTSETSDSICPVPMLGSGWCAKTISLPSGDQSNERTWKAPEVRRVTGRSEASPADTGTTYRWL